MGNNRKWLYYMEKTPDGEQFLMEKKRNRAGHSHINLWHIQGEHTWLYTIRTDKKIKRVKEWDLETVRNLVENLKSPNPYVHVTRFAFDNQIIFAEEGLQPLPEIPDPPGTIKVKQIYVMFGKFKGTEIERSWRLSRKLEGVIPGQLVIVPGRKRAGLVTVTRVEPADMDNLPRSYALKVVANEEEYSEYLKEEAIRKQEHAKKKLEDAKKKEAEIGPILAPYILYGKFRNNSKEYSWNLTPDKPKRQGIEPGDRVFVWTNEQYSLVTVTRIEKRDGRKKKQPKPTARVKCKYCPPSRPMRAE